MLSVVAALVPAAWVTEGRMSGGLVSIRTHSWHSLLEGVAGPQALVERAASLGYGAVALTDSNTLAGCVEFSEAARKAGVRAVLGASLRRDRVRATALIAEPSGWRSLCRVISRLHGPSSHLLPMLLAECNEGLHLLCDDPHLFRPPLTDAYRGRLWAEVVRPGPSSAAEAALLEAAALVDARPVASLACRLAGPGDHAACPLLYAARTGKALEQVPAALGVLPAHHLAAAEDVAARFHDLPDALPNARRLAEACRTDVLPRGAPLPATVPQGQTPAGYLRLLCERACATKGWREDADARRRLDHELHVICQLDLAPYFLATAEIAADARRGRWPTAVRGSAAGSLCCHLLGISDIDPLRHGLRFERFLHAGRSDLPDIDLEVADQARRPLWNAVVKRYGKQRVARVGLVQHFRWRSAFEASALAHGLRPDQVKAARGQLGDALAAIDAPDGAELPPAPHACQLDPDAWHRVLAGARLLTGRPHIRGHHDSGFVLTSCPAEDVLPLEAGPGGVGVSQLDRDGVARVGLVKIDLLSSHALSALAAAREQSAALASPEEAAAGEGAGDDNPATLAMLADGDTLGIGQVETPSMRRLLRQLRPRSLGDLVQALALARPAAATGRAAFLRRRHGLEPAAPAHPLLAPALRDGHGLLIFEDDVLAAVEAMAGLPAAEADRLRRALAGGEEGAAEAFLAACERNGVAREAAAPALAQITRFCDSYGFGKGHAVSVALVAWQEASCKAARPAAFWAASLNHHTGGYPLRTYVEAVKRAGVPVHGPCVNRSAVGWTQEVSAVRAGLAAVRKLSEGSPEAAAEERARGGPFGGLKDFLRRVTVPEGDAALLVRVGAFDFEGRSRQRLLQENKLGAHAHVLPAPEGRGRPEPWPLELPATHPHARRWREEWGLLGWLPGPPLMQQLRPYLPAGLADSRSLGRMAGRRVRLAGLLAAAKEAGAEGARVEFLSVEDEHGLAEVHLPAGARDQSELAPLVIAEGVVQQRHGVPFLAAGLVERALPCGAGTSRSTSGDGQADGGEEDDGPPGILRINTIYNGESA